MSPLRRLWNIVRRGRMDEDLRQELDTHLALIEEEERREGVTAEQARQNARSRFGNPLSHRERALDAVIATWVEDAWKDIRGAIRQLRKTPGFTAVAVITLSLCIGANSALFSVINVVLLRPLPFERADQLYAVSATYQGARREFTSFTDFADWRARNHVFVQMAAIRGDGASITTPTGPEYLTGAAASEGFFALFRVQPILGRAFLAAEHRSGQDRVVILSHALWLRRFGGNPAVIGTSVVLNSEPNTVVGVMPPGFVFPDEAELWRPLTLTASDAGRRADLVQVVARLRSDSSPALAQTEMTAIARQLEEQYPATNASWGVQLVPLQGKSTENVRRTLLVLWWAVACVLLIGCANVGVLLLSRGIRRAHELAVRTALGAGRGRLIRQLLTESVLVGILGGIGSLLVAAWGIVALRAIAPDQSARFQAVGLDPSVLVFTAAVSVATGLIVGLVPVWRIMHSDLDSALRAGGRSASGGLRHRHLMRVLVIGQVTVSLVLLIGAGLMVKTLGRLQAVTLGFNPDHLLTFYVSLPVARYPKTAQAKVFFQQLIERTRALPGVRSATAVNALYMQWSRAYVVPVRIEGRPAPDQSHPPDTHVRMVDPEIHRVLQIPMLRGRAFTPQDGSDASHSVVINEAMARRYFANEDPIGHRISVLSSPRSGPIWEEIVGVVGDVRQEGLDADAFPEIQMPFTQSPVNTMAILVRTSGDPGALAPSLRTQVQALDPHLPLMLVQTMEEVVAKSLAARRFVMRLLSIFGSVALMLTTIGLYGVMAAGVSDRTREIAVRLALGASPSRVMWTVVRHMLIITLVGVTAGVVVAGGATRYLEPLLFGVTRTDLATYGATAAILVMVALVSSYLPARRVTRVDPAATLRSE